ncbi:hypothetical protein Scani_07260 [Streptomyces caniferus]|uniref:Uncharacterized protein n=1 Tax=Streptomyces caniferus TaxID=285557 RepID=A0A640S057_9ACTN|nr:hypothetical protein Scani_07260 [Streptomyces caniferus]
MKGPRDEGREASHARCAPTVRRCYREANAARIRPPFTIITTPGNRTPHTEAATTMTARTDASGARPPPRTCQGLDGSGAVAWAPGRPPRTLPSLPVVSTYAA